MDFSQIAIRCHALGNVVEDPKKTRWLTLAQHNELLALQARPTRTEKQDQKLQELIGKADADIDFDLTQTAKRYVENLVRETLFQFRYFGGSRATQKGTMTEQDVIDMLNRVDFKSYKKNEDTYTNDYVSGTCDIKDEQQALVIDVKSSETKKTFPMIPEEGKSALYEAQLRGYCYLLNSKGILIKNMLLVYGLVDTPDELIKDYEDTSLHYVSNIPEILRITKIGYTRCEYFEAKIEYKVKECRKYAQHYYNQIISKNG